MNSQFKEDASATVKALKLGADNAELRFVTLAGESPAQIPAHAEWFKKHEAEFGRWIGPEIYGSADLDISGFPCAGETSFLGTQAEAGLYRGAQACAICGANARAIEFEGRDAGVLYEDDFASYALVGGLLPRDAKACRTAQTLDVFEQMEGALKNAGMDFSHVGRTWFYNDNILDWYDEFNRARDAFFTERGVFDRLVPASTGVGSRNKNGAALMARVFAVKPKGDGVRFEAVASPLQCPAPDYRSSFSRAVELVHPNFRHLIISGTASIGPGGKTAHVGDMDKQIELTLDVLEAILKSRNMRWEDTVRAVAYIKNIADAPRFLEIRRRRGLDALPFVWIQSDVCRDDLLFEIEMDAAAPAA